MEEQFRCLTVVFASHRPQVAVSSIMDADLSLFCQVRIHPTVSEGHESRKLCWNVVLGAQHAATLLCPKHPTQTYQKCVC